MSYLGEEEKTSKLGDDEALEQAYEKGYDEGYREGYDSGLIRGQVTGLDTANMIYKSVTKEVNYDKV